MVASRDPVTVLTSAQASAFTDHLQAAADALFDEGASPDKVLRESLTTEEYTYVTETAALEGVAASDTAAWGDFLASLREKVANLPRIHLHLAALPSPALIDWLLEWFAAFGPGPAQLDIAVEPELVAGLVIESDGRVYDLSMKDQLASHVDKLPNLS